MPLFSCPIKVSPVDSSRVSTISFALIMLFSAVCHAVADDAKPAQIPLPQIPDHTFNIVDFGASLDGTELNTVSIEKAIAACAKAGGGVVQIPAGTFRTGPFSLISNLNLHLDEGAKLLISNDPADFKLDNGRYENIISATDCHDISITGKGTIDGQGESWWRQFVRARFAPEEDVTPAHRPFLVQLLRCKRVLVKDVTLTNSPMFHLVPDSCQDVTIEGVHFIAPARAPNTDALDPSGWNFLINKCTFDVGDDCIAIKATHQIDPSQPACINFLVTNCTFLHGHGLSIGGQTNGGLKHLVVRDCTFENTEAGIRMKAGRGAGGLVEDLSYDNLTMKSVKTAILITSYYPKIPPQPGNDPAKDVNPRTPIWRNIRITNLQAVGSTTAGRILGLPEMPITDIVMKNVSIKADKPFQIVNAHDISFESSQITSRTEPAVTLEHAEVNGIDPATGK